MPNNPTTPVRWTIFGLTRTIFSLMFSKAQRQVRDQLSEHELILFSAINRDHTSKLSERVIGLTKRFPQNIAVFKKMVRKLIVVKWKRECLIDLEGNSVHNNADFGHV